MHFIKLDHTLGVSDNGDYSEGSKTNQRELWERNRGERAGAGIKRKPTQNIRSR